MPNVYSGGRLSIAHIVGKYAAGPGDLSSCLRKWRDAIEYFGAPSRPSRSILQVLTNILMLSRVRIAPPSKSLIYTTVIKRLSPATDPSHFALRVTQKISVKFYDGWPRLPWQRNFRQNSIAIFVHYRSDSIVPALVVPNWIVSHKIWRTYGTRQSCKIDKI